jgi:hypothetical protein
MKKLACVALLIASATLAGCMYGAKNDCCGEYQANCCGWEFYKACDLIEGRRADCEPDPCAGQEIIIVREAPAEDAPAAMPADAPETMEMAPAAPSGE